ncbi:hypothetical protein [Schaalia sp. ZJ1691]|uniref:hypothetical protein n=1 Tax=Schaalia sp. ZJ1691 TaxID=2709404 RepID=UPI0013EB74EB|nr:hypothetical protein [Schaalia sp. ZJ1691]
MVNVEGLSVQLEQRRKVTARLACNARVLCQRWARGDEGRVGMLILAGAALVLVGVFMSAATTCVAVQNMRLVSCADRVVAYAAGAVDEEDYYSQKESGGARVSVTGARVRAAAALERLRRSACDVGAGVILQRVGVHENTVSVALSAQATVEFLPGPIAGAILPVLERESAATLEYGSGEK